MSWKENINSIKEIYTGHYQIILDFATVDFLRYALSDEYKFVWISHHIRSSIEWNSYNLPLFDNNMYYNIQARNINFDFIMPTNQFKTILSNIGPGIMLTQLNELPKYYLDPITMKSKTRYDLLKKECDYLFEIEIPSATDYGTLISSNLEYLQSLIDNPDINWSDLP